MSPTRSAASLFAAIIALFTLSVGSSAQVLPWDGPFPAGEPSAILKSAASVAPPSKHNSVLLLHEEKFTFDAAGRRVQSQHLVVRVLTAAGVDEWSSMQAVYEPWHEERPRLNARVITADAAVHILEQKTVSEAAVHAESNDLYSDDRVVRAPLPAVAPGSVVEEETVFTDTKPMFEAGVFHKVYFGWRMPVAKSRLLIDVPENAPLKYELKLLPAVSIQKKNNSGRLQVSFENGPLEGVEDGEPDRPTDTPNWPQIGFSIARSWGDVASSYSKEVDAKIDGAQVKPFVDIALQNKDRVKIADSLIEQLHKNVRYTGIEFGESALIPHLPSETLSRKYGDCKDKSALLVAMLRGAGIPAYLALLSAGPGQDISREIPGMGDFDHAIVYAPGTPDLWIDATAKFLRAGELPSGDQGRWSLVVRPETTTLLLTPELPSSSSRQVETREFFLPEEGPARVVETTETFGLIDASYRSFYGGAETKDMRKGLEDYVKSAYLAEKLDKFDRGDPDNLAKPFFIRLEAGKAKRGTVTATEAAVATPLSPILLRLPAYLREDDGPAPDPEKKDDHNSTYKVRQHDLILPEAFVTEWHYKIHPAPGYKLRALPQDVTQHIGPALLTRKYQQGPDNLVLATISFDTVRNHWTAAEVEAARQDIRDLGKQDVPFIAFNETGFAALQAGNAKEALETYARLLAAHPREARHHTQVALAYLAAGLGESAREEARRAVQLEPTSVNAYKELAYILQADLIGRRLRRGFDFKGAQAAFQKALELDPDDQTARANYAILLEHNPEGIHYESGAQLDRAIALYGQIKQEKLEEMGVSDNVLFDLMFAGRFKELKLRCASLPRTSTRTQLMLVAVAVTDGAPAAIQQATSLTSDDKARSVALVNAGETLSKVRKYPLAAQLLSAGAPGSEDPAAVLARASVFARAKPYEETFYPKADPRRAVQEMYATMFFSPEIDRTIFKRFSRYHLDEKSMASDLEGWQVRSRNVQRNLRSNGVPLQTTEDLLAASTEYSVEGDDPNGYRVHLQAPGQTLGTYYLVREDDSYKVLEINFSQESIGAYILLKLADSDLGAARHWLNWAREDQKLGGGDDALSGRAFPWFWTRGEVGERDRVRYAAAALASLGPHAGDAIPVLLEGRAKATSAAERLHFDLALYQAYNKLQKFDDAVTVSRRLVDADKYSLSAFEDLVYSLHATGNLGEARKVAEVRLSLLPDDRDALKQLAVTAALGNQPKESQKFNRRIIALGKGTARDYNSIAWSDVLAGTVSEESLETARRGVALSESKNGAILHTLAALYAEMGKTNEARDVILQTMNVWELDQPDGQSWYVYGRIAEAYKLPNSAIKAYQRVEAPEVKHFLNDTTYAVAQRRLAILLNKEPAKPGN